ncbi:hypothetical protein [Streptomyces sp. NPDC056987]
MKSPFRRRCGHAPGATSPRDQANVDVYRTLLAASTRREALDTRP